MKRCIGYLFVVVACGGGGSSSDLPDAMQTMRTVGGTARQRTGISSAPVGDVAITVYKQDEQTALATTTTDAMGKFTLTYSASGAIEIVLEATKSGFVTSYFYPAGPIATDATMFPIDMMSTANHAALYTAANLALDPAKGTVELTISSSNSTLAAATIATQPASPAYLYNDANGQPSAAAGSTAADGIGYALDAPAGLVTINANKAGVVLKMPRFVVRAGSLSQAVVTP